MLQIDKCTNEHMCIDLGGCEIFEVGTLSPKLVALKFVLLLCLSAQKRQRNVLEIALVRHSKVVFWRRGDVELVENCTKRHSKHPTNCDKQNCS